MSVAGPHTFWIAEAVRCSRPATPVGRLILADTGLYFVPGRRSRAARRTDQAWLSHALSDDESLEDPAFQDLAAAAPAAQVAAIRGAFHLAPETFSAALAGRVLSVTAGDERLDFTLPAIVGGSLRDWLAHLDIGRAAS